jgi:hypothetical protein
MDKWRRLGVRLEDCQLCDLGFKGVKYTWSNGRFGGEFTKERLDRVVANSEWRNLWGDVTGSWCLLVEVQTIILS